MSKEEKRHHGQSAFDSHVASKNSGAYHPGPVSEDYELERVRAQQNDLQLEEFSDGPYGAATNPDKLGKSSPWKSGQRTVSAFRDANPISNPHKTVEEEPKFNGSRGSIEGEN